MYPCVPIPQDKLQWQGPQADSPVVLTWVPCSGIGSQIPKSRVPPSDLFHAAGSDNGDSHDYGLLRMGRCDIQGGPVTQRVSARNRCRQPR